MSSIVVTLEDDVLDAARRVAESHGLTIEEYVRSFLKRSARSSGSTPIFHLFATADSMNINSGGQPWDRSSLYDEAIH